MAQDTTKAMAKLNIEDGNSGSSSSLDEVGQFPKVQGGGSLMLAWQVRGKKALVIGGGEVRFVPFFRLAPPFICLRFTAHY